MKIVVASTFVPTIEGGGTQIVRDCAATLAAHGHDTDIVTLPVWETWDQLPGQILAVRLFELSHTCDRLITLRTPAHMLRHPNKLVWFLHHHRGAYDLWGTEHQDIPDTAEGRQVRDMLHEADTLGLGEARRVYAISRVTQQRLMDFNHVAAQVLHPPLADVTGYRCEDAEPYVFYPSRITPAKRQLLAVQAMAHAPRNVRLVIAGPADQPEHRDALLREIEQKGLGDRVEVRAEWISEKDKRDLFARCLACVFPPFDEDYGYVALEACQSRKPLITCRDSGGPLLLVEDGASGLVADPTPEGIGAAITTLAEHPARAREMGQHAFGLIAARGIGWDRIVEEFTR